MGCKAETKCNIEKTHFPKEIKRKMNLFEKKKRSDYSYLKKNCR